VTDGIDVDGAGERRPRRIDAARPVTIAHIAESAGVSVPTVSKVINGRAGVSAGTRARVEELVNRYGYSKSPSLARSPVVELVFRELDSMWAVEIIRGVERVAARNRLGLLVSRYAADSTGAPAWSDIVARRPQCVVLVAQVPAAEREQLRASGIPFVVYDPIVDLPADVPFVGATNWAGGRAATRHLLGLGHRRIAMVSGPDDVLCCRARLDGYRAALESAGVPIDPDLIVRAGLNRDDGCVAARTLLDRPDRPTAIFAANDPQALGVYQAARALGLRIPEDLSVVGFDDLPVVAWVEPPMTTVRQPLGEMAAAATELALSLGRGEPVARLGLEIGITLTIRSSTAPPGKFSPPEKEDPVGSD
jgi:DNA-binding LacI/PurR family transcriptional regulator